MQTRTPSAERSASPSGPVVQTGALAKGGPVKSNAAQQEKLEADQAAQDGRKAAAAPTSDAGAKSEAGKNGPRPEPQIQVSAGSFEEQGLTSAVMDKALTAFRSGWSRGDTDKTIFTIIDFTQPSDQKRLYVIDLATGKLLHHELVTHGKNSGGRYANKFSNKNESNQSSIGLAKTAETYESAKFGGTALRLDGLEKGFNDKMRDRAVVMHQAAYATPEAVATNAASGDKRLGRSQGCPAMDPKVAGKVIKTIRNGTLVFSYYPDPDYLKKSSYVNPEQAN